MEIFSILVRLLIDCSPQRVQADPISTPELESVMTKQVLRPGKGAPESAIYDVVGPRGGSTGHQVVSTARKPLPPTPKSGQGYVEAEPAHHPHRRK